jgi:hypothetical protein
MDGRTEDNAKTFAGRLGRKAEANWLVRGGNPAVPAIEK